MTNTANKLPANCWIISGRDAAGLLQFWNAARGWLDNRSGATHYTKAALGVTTLPEGDCVAWEIDYDLPLEV